MDAAKRNVDFDKEGIQMVRIRRAITGGVIIEVPGKDSTAKTENLANRLKEVFSKNGEIRVARWFSTEPRYGPKRHEEERRTRRSSEGFKGRWPSESYECIVRSPTGQL